MTIFNSKTALGQDMVPSLNTKVGAVIAYEYVTTAVLAAGDIIKLGTLEANVKPLHCALVTDDLDTGGSPAITLTAGILNAAGTDIDAAATSSWITASTIGQAGGYAPSTSGNAYLSGASSVNRQLGIKVVAGPATSAVAGKKIALLVTAGG